MKKRLPAKSRLSIITELKGLTINRDSDAGNSSLFRNRHWYLSPEHPPPHFQAVYGEYQIIVDIKTGVVQGTFPKRALRHVLEWYDEHQQELLEAWDCIQAGRQLSAKKLNHWSNS